MVKDDEFTLEMSFYTHFITLIRSAPLTLSYFLCILALCLPSLLRALLLLRLRAICHCVSFFHSLTIAYLFIFLFLLFVSVLHCWWKFSFLPPLLSSMVVFYASIGSLPLPAAASRRHRCHEHAVVVCCRCSSTPPLLRLGHYVYWD